MKKILFILLVLIKGVNSFSQDANCNKENVTTSTDWTKYNANDRNFPNNWNWTQTGVSHPVYLNNNLNSPSFYIQLPYFCGLSAGSGGCGNLNTLQYEILENNNTKQDVFPEDGWELLVKNFGKGNSTSFINDGRGVANPYFILYNRYNGKMKIFYSIIGQRPQQNAGYLQIYLFDKNTKRATFAHVEPIAQSLQDFHPRNNFKVLNDFATMTTSISYYWLVGEIQTAYDPCTCTSNNIGDPLVVVQPFLSTVTSIEAKIEGLQTQKLANNGSVSAESNGKTSFLDLAQGAGEAGVKSYTQFEGYRSQVTDFLDKRNDAYKNKLVKDWWENSAVKSNLSGVEREAKFKELMGYDQNVKKLLGIDKIDKYDNTLGAIKQVAGLFPYVGTAIGVIDFFISGGKKEDAKPSPPMVFDVNLKLKGELKTPVAQPEITFDLPGAKPSSNGSLNPLYNRTLGVFNIVKAPAMEFFELKPTVKLENYRYDFRNDCEKGTDQFGEGYYKAQTQSAKQFRLKEDVKYLLNPSAGLDVEMIDACFILEYKGNQNLFLNNPLAFDTTAAIPMHSKIYGDTLLYGRGISFENRIKSIEESGWDLEYVSKDYPTAPNSFIRFRTKYMPLQCLRNLNFTVWGGKAPKLYIKMLVKTKRKDLITAEGVNNILTYDISKSIIEATKNSTEGSITHNIYARTTGEWPGFFFCGNFFASKYSYNNFKYVPSADWDSYPFLGSSRYDDFIINSLPLANPYYRYPSNFVDSKNYLNSLISSDVNVSGNITIYDNATVASNVTLRTLGSINIGQNVTFGSNVQLIAGKSVDVNPNIAFNAGVTITILPSAPTDIFGCNNPNIAALHATTDEIYGAINGICNNKIYKDSTKIQSLIGQEDNDTIVKVKIKKGNLENRVKFDCSPNPFSNFFTINYELNNDEFVNISLVNSLGQMIKTIINRKVEIGSYQEHVSTEGLPPGVYILTLRTQNGTETKKIVKQ
jgi:acetyltransferase-like isoleucine patch superfamily enzyme